MSSRTTAEFRTCQSCGLTVEVGHHGLIDCIDHLRAQVTRLHRENIAANARAAVAEEQLDEIRKLLAA